MLMKSKRRALADAGGGPNSLVWLFLFIQTNISECWQVRYWLEIEKPIHKTLPSPTKYICIMNSSIWNKCVSNIESTYLVHDPGIQNQICSIKQKYNSKLSFRNTRKPSFFLNAKLGKCGLQVKRRVHTCSHGHGMHKKQSCSAEEWGR